MQDLVDQMTDANPLNRPLIEDVVAKFSRIRESLSGWNLRLAMVSKAKPSLLAVFHLAVFRLVVSRLAVVRLVVSHLAVFGLAVFHHAKQALCEFGLFLFS